MLLRPIDIDQFIGDQNLGLDISGDGNTKSYFIFDGEKGFIHLVIDSFATLI